MHIYVAFTTCILYIMQIATIMAPAYDAAIVLAQCFFGSSSTFWNINDQTSIIVINWNNRYFGIIFKIK